MRASELLAESAINGNFAEGQKELKKCEIIVETKNKFIFSAERINFQSELMTYITTDLINCGMIECKEFKWLTMTMKGFNAFILSLTNHSNINPVVLQSDKSNLIEFLKENFEVNLSTRKIEDGQTSLLMENILTNDKYHVYFDLVNFDLLIRS
jgi:hypothetical protein